MRQRGRGPSEAPSVEFERPGFRFIEVIPLADIEAPSKRPAEWLRKWTGRIRRLITIKEKDR